ncbi:MAG: DUF2281 domain-containing protein [Xenococcaceae cyanobacterium]
MVTESLTANSTPSTIAKTVMDKLNKLPLEQQQEVLDFVEFLAQRSIPRQSIWDKIEARMAQVPPEVLAELPADASENLDHYLYGTPKK